MPAVPDLALPGVRMQDEETALLVIPRWGLWMMMLASALGTYLLFMQLKAGS